jgi:hypothetical protein
MRAHFRRFAPETQDAGASSNFAKQNCDQPGFPLQVLGFAHANPVGFPLQSLAHRRAAILHSKIATIPLRLTG